MKIGQIDFEEEKPIGGVNPLTLAIVLVIITVLIAAGLSYWATNISSVKPGSAPKTDCEDAEFSLFSGTYDSSTSVLQIILDNPTRVDLHELSVYLVYLGDRIVEKSLDGILKRNTLQTFKVSDVEKDFQRGVIKTHCPNVQVRFTISNGTLTQSS